VVRTALLAALGVLLLGVIWGVFPIGEWFAAAGILAFAMFRTWTVGIRGRERLPANRLISMFILFSGTGALVALLGYFLGFAIRVFMVKS